MPPSTVKFKPLGGPDGGNGGRGGDVILTVDQSVTTLLDYHHSPHRKATNGKPGEGGNRSGKDGEDWSCPCPTAPSSSTARATCWPTWSATAPPTSPRRAAGAASATRRWPPRGARRPASRCSVSPATSRTSTSS